MSLSSALARVPLELAEPIAKLIVKIITSPNPRDATARAERALIADAADAATDAALRKVLK